jgi:hypothetical protein
VGHPVSKAIPYQRMLPHQPHQPATPTARYRININRITAKRKGKRSQNR